MPAKYHLDPEARIAALRAKHQDPRALADALIAEVWSLESQGTIAPAAFAQEALRVSREAGYSRGIALGLLETGFSFYMRQQNHEAFRLVLEAQPRLEETGETAALAKCMAVLAGLHYTMGNHQKTLEYAHDALSLTKELEKGQWHGWPHYMLGDAYRAMGDLDRARKHYEQVYSIFREIDHKSGVARALIGLGNVCRMLGDLDASAAYFADARQLLEGIDDPVSIARVLSEVALLHQLKGEHGEARRLFEESLALRRNTGAPLIVATCLIDLGKLFLAIDQPGEAVVRLKEALEITEREDHKPRMYAAHEALSDAYYKLDDLASALEHFREFQRVKEEVMTTDADSRLHNLEISLEAAAAQKEAELVKRHNKELKQKNAELARLLQELRDAQEMLIQSEKMASLGQLTAGIAHEIKNPLNFVNNFSVLTKDLAVELAGEIEEHRRETVEAVEPELRELTEEIAANADRILEHGRRAGQIVNSMLVHSRQSGGKKTEVDVNELVLTCIDLAFHGFTASQDEYEPALDCEFTHDIGSFTVIEDEVARVLTNILNNAFYATSRHAQTVGDGYDPRVRVKTALSDGSVEITISDNGPGISDEHKKKVFEPFFTTKPAGTGTGLGLSQSYEIITKRHGGMLRVADTPGGGATFVVAIPVA